jgi:hypothetical protein
MKIAFNAARFISECTPRVPPPPSAKIERRLMQTNSSLLTGAACLFAQSGPH